MKILILGGSGFVSGTLARMAIAEGHEVWTITRGNKPIPAGVRSIVADRSDAQAVSDALRNAGTTWDLAVDCIGYEVENARQDISLFLSDDESICNAFVFISTDFVFHPEHRIFPQPEHAEEFIESGYGYKKRQCELLFNEQAKRDCWTVLRPCHIYGPGSQLGCLPDHGRDPNLLDTIRRGDPLKLVGAGTYLQQPIFAADLAAAILSVPGASSAAGKIFNIAGPEIIESRTYYEIIANRIGADLRIEELPVDAYRAAHPDKQSFLCHRIYSLDALESAGIRVPDTGVEAALAQHVESLLKPAN